MCKKICIYPLRLFISLAINDRSPIETSQSGKVKYLIQLAEHSERERLICDIDKIKEGQGNQKVNNIDAAYSTLPLAASSACMATSLVAPRPMRV